MAACTTYSSRELFDWLRLSPRYAANRNVITWTTCKRATAEERAEQLGWWTYRIDRALQLRISCQQVLAQLGTAWCAHRLLSLSLSLSPRLFCQCNWQYKKRATLLCKECNRIPPALVRLPMFAASISYCRTGWKFACKWRMLFEFVTRSGVPI